MNLVYFDLESQTTLVTVKEETPEDEVAQIMGFFGEGTYYWYPVPEGWTIKSVKIRKNGSKLTMVLEENEQESGLELSSP